MEGKNLVWLASYPKSGNTWFRVFLTNLLNKNEKPASINDLLATTIASSRQMFDEATGLSASDLTKEEIEELRPEVYRYVSRNATELSFHKIHDALILTANQEFIVPADVSAGAIYFLRNPLDLVLSFSNHTGDSIDAMIELMNKPGYSFCAKTDKLYNQLEQKLLSWSMHVKSWLDQDIIPVCLLKYEDMKNETLASFKKAVDFVGITASDDEIQRALELSRLEKLQEQEREVGFRERSPQSKVFFKRGGMGAWKMELSSDQVKRIIENHFDMMLRMGYIDKNGIPL
jgi:aryl sulfotransferase